MQADPPADPGIEGRGNLNRKCMEVNEEVCGGKVGNVFEKPRFPSRWRMFQQDSDVKHKSGLVRGWSLNRTHKRLSRPCESSSSSGFLMTFAPEKSKEKASITRGNLKAVLIE